MDILRVVYKARPEVQWENDFVNGFSLGTIKAAYVGDDFPSQIELDEAWLLCQEEDRVEACVEKLSQTDQSTIRIVEDLIEVLIQKGGISIDDLPAQAQEKLTARKALRDEISGG